MPSCHRLSSRLPRFAVVFGVLLSVLALAPGALAASHAAKSVKKSAAAKAHDSSSGPAEGIFDNCDLSTELSVCEQRLSVMARAGLRVVVLGGIGLVSEQNLQAYAGFARSLGMGVMWELNDPGFWGGAWTGSSAAADFSQFAGACGCTSTTGVLDAMIGFLSGLPGTYGYYAADDESITPGQGNGLREFVSEIKRVDPDHMVMVGASAGQGQSNATSGAVLGNEIYPVTTGQIADQNNNLAVWDEVQQQITQSQTSATRHQQASAFILQAFTFGDNLADGQAVGVCTAQMTQQQCYHKLLYPSSQVQLELRNEVLAHSHPKLILWYSFQQTYGQAGTDTYSLYPTGALAHARWQGLTEAINAPLPALATAARAHTNKRTHKTSGHKTRGHHTTNHNHTTKR